LTLKGTGFRPAGSSGLQKIIKQTRVFVVMRLIVLFMILLLTGCASTLPPPQNKENVGAIFREYPHWYKAAKKTERKWGVPVSVQMAIIYYESAFKGDARTPLKRIFGIPTGKHISSAYGYAQALDGTWEEYLDHAGGWFARRNKFESASDFIGWYSDRARKSLGIPSSDPYNLYLAYHEGLGGYQRQSYVKKPWLMAYARKVACKTQVFQDQLAYYEDPYCYRPVPMQTAPVQPCEILPDIDPPECYSCECVEP
jgi:hypothetical protein